MMTRFARAKGSKASNERLPENATSWTEIKQQLLEKNKEASENKKRKEAIDRRNANYKAFLDDKEKEETKQSKWADFPEVTRFENTKTNESKKKKVTTTKNNNSEKIVKNQETSSDDETFKQLKAKVDSALEASIAENGSDSDAPPDENSAKIEIKPPIVKVKKMKKKKLNIVVHAEAKQNHIKPDPKDNNFGKNMKRKFIEDQEDEQNGGTKHKVGKSKEDEDVDKAKLKRKKVTGNEGEPKVKKGKNKSKKVNDQKTDTHNIKKNLTENDLKKIEKKKQKRIKQVEKKKKVKAELKQRKEMETELLENDKQTVDNPENETATLKGNNANINQSNNTKAAPKNKFDKSVGKKNNKVLDKTDHQRKKPLLPHKMFINGKELEIDYVDGFPVKKEDAERLKKLRKEMISKGLPRSEINIALKLERRKAEKAFTREKKKVCFNCRKSGHNLSECPELDKNQVAQTAGSGICFKCGSTEHTHFECKVVRGQDFKFAQCFVCNEQGHIARQCPDNARGLYPKGGACNVCGDVTHLKRDCPVYQSQQQRQEERFRAETLDDGNPDVLEKEDTGRRQENKRSNKIIKF